MPLVDYWVPNGEANSSSRVVAAYLRAYSAPGSLVVDPFCQSPALVAEAVASGRRVIAVSFNPLDALRTRMALTAIPIRELIAAVTRLGDSLKADVPLREQLQRLYRTTCAHCQKPVYADYFIWERGQPRPKRVYYRCSACGDTGLRDFDDSDAAVLQEVQPRGLHYWYILHRVARGDRAGTRLAESLLELYTPRNLYALANILIKMETLFSDAAMLDALRLGLLRALEQGSKLNPVPGELSPPHPAGLHPPPRFVEWNAWQLFEDMTRRLGQQQPTSPVPLATTVQEVASSAAALPETEQSLQARAFVGHLSVRQLVPLLANGSASLIWVCPPPLGRTQWALPYLWSGWLYGHDAAALLWPLVQRRSSDRAWYLQAMRSTFTVLRRILHSDGHLVLVGQSKGLAYHETLTLAAAGADLRLESALYYPREPEEATKPFGGLRGDYRSVWMPGPSVPQWPMAIADLTTRLHETAVAAARETLQVRGEPLPFARLHCHIWEALAQRGVLQRAISSKEMLSPLQWVSEQVRVALQAEVSRTFVQLWEEGPEGECQWWLAKPSPVEPLTERVERKVYETLAAVDSIDSGGLMSEVCAHFPGALSPSGEWIAACLKSYGQLLPGGRWALREAERPSERHQAREKTLQTLLDLGQKWGYRVQMTPNHTVRWESVSREEWIFAVLDSAALSTLLHIPTEASAQLHRFAVITEARQELLRWRWARSPALRRELTGQGWQFIQDHGLQRWAGQEDIAPADLHNLASLDPLATRSRTQLSLI